MSRYSSKEDMDKNQIRCCDCRLGDDEKFACSLTKRKVAWTSWRSCKKGSKKPTAQ